MEQDIRFCTTSDGVRIAYAVTGSGQPLVRVLGWFTHLEMDLNAPWVKASVEAMSSRYTYVRYDGRGMGLSDREVTDFSVESQVKDLEAVIDATGHPTVALFAPSQGGPVAITYAVRQPERVSHLVLYGSFAQSVQPRDEHETQLWEALIATVRHGWGSDNPAFRQTWTAMFMPDADAERIKWFNELQRMSTSADNAANFVTQLRDFDVRELLAMVDVPTLVFHCRGDRLIRFSQGRDLAAGIPNARFVPLESNNHALTVDDPAWEVLNRTLDEFLGVASNVETQPAVASPAGMVTILFTDMEGSTALAQRVGDAAAQNVRRAHNEIVRDALQEHEGSEIKHTGDGIMASFATASAALACAVAIQRGVAAHVAEQPDSPLGVYIGLNAGEPIAEDDDLFGTSVDLAARICDRAQAGEILASDVVRQLAAGKGFLFSDRGETELRGFEDPVKLYDVRWRDEGSP